MPIYHFQFYWPSNLILVVTCVTYVPNLRKIRVRKTVVVIMDDRYFGQTHTQTDNAMHCIGQTVRRIYDQISTLSSYVRLELVCSA